MGKKSESENMSEYTYTAKKGNFYVIYQTTEPDNQWMRSTSGAASYRATGVGGSSRDFG
jgi:hypothetical protein